MSTQAHSSKDKHEKGATIVTTADKPSTASTGSETAAPPPATLQEFPPLPTQEENVNSNAESTDTSVIDVPVPEPPVPNNSYADVTKHGVEEEKASSEASSQEEAPRQHRRRSSEKRSSPHSRSLNMARMDHRADIAKIFATLGVATAIVGRSLKIQRHVQSGDYLFFGGLITAALSGISWFWLHRRASHHHMLHRQGSA